MEDSTPLAQVLRHYMHRTGATADRLAKESTVSKQTITHWVKGRVKKPQQWKPLLLVASALHLTEPETSALLGAAGYSPLDQLRSDLHALVASLKDRERMLLERQLQIATDQAHERAMQHLRALPLDALPDPLPLPRGSRMPLARNPLFVGRAAQLRALAQLLMRGETVAVTGMGGIGKTQLAVEFVHRYGQYFAGGVFWLSFADPAGVPAEIAACGGAAHLSLRPNWESVSFEEQVRLVQAAWSSPLPRLLIFDNCEDEALLQQWRPPTGGCHLLMTTRRAYWDPALGVHALLLEVLQRDESVLLLRRFLPDGMTDRATLEAIAEELGDLPLALHLAGHFLARYQHAITPAAYLRDLRASTVLHHPSLRVGGISPTKYNQHVGQALARSYTRLDPHDVVDQQASALLARAACFAPGEPIPRDLLVSTLEHQQAAPSTRIVLEDALARLCALGLVEPVANGALRLHRLVSAFVHDRNEDPQAQGDVEATLLDLMQRANDASDVTTLVGLHPHLRFVTDRARHRRAGRAAQLCEALGHHFWLLARYADAQSSLEHALAIHTALPQPDPLGLASTYNLLALLRTAQGQLAQARAMSERALALWEAAAGPDDDRTITEWNNLGYLLLLLGEYPHAQTYLRRALHARHRRLGLAHNDTARSVHNLGWLVYKQGRYRRAQCYLQVALNVRKRLFSQPHVSTAQTLNNLGEVLYAQRRYAEAWDCQQQAFAMRKALFSDEHPDIAESYYNLGRILHAQGKLADARSYLERALQINQAVVETATIDTLYIFAAFAALLRDQGEHTEAQAYLEQAIAAWEEYGGAEHPELVQPLYQLGLVRQQQGDVRGARIYFERALAIACAKLDEQHPDTAILRATLAALED